MKNHNRDRQRRKSPRAAQLLQCHGGCNLKRGVDHLNSGRERIWGRLSGCLHLLGALCLVGISLPRLLQYRQIFAWLSSVHHETDEY